MTHANKSNRIELVAAAVEHAAAQEARKLHDNWKAEHQARYDEILREIDDIDASIKRDLDLAAREAEDRVEKLGQQDAKDLQRPDNLSPKAIFSQWLRRGDEGLSAEQRAAVIRNTMSTTTTTEGGHTVATEVAGEKRGLLFVRVSHFARSLEIDEPVLGRAHPLQLFI